MEHKTLKFKKELADMILRGEKYTTWRLFDDKNITAGDVCDLLLYETKEVFSVGKVLAVRETTFAELSSEDWDGHEKFDSEETMYTTYTNYYKQPVGPHTPLKIIKLGIQPLT
ncbi:MAG: hypothetical protein HGB03_01415 [Candidatus Yonathbacteria bacterium]|nr:hypothetical protein [Candidatus Yonathbacteria bacterium]NTW47922.1 hypothetical protein [Candidatus Yonathbacteria bacterium]